MREKAMVYCVIPRELASKLQDALERSYQDDPAITVVVEQREADRRTTIERRAAQPGIPMIERRRIRNPAGYRVAERRAVLVPVDGRPLPRKARAHADRLVFVEALAPPPEYVEDIEAARLIARFQGGEEAALLALYTRYFDRIYTYLRITLKNARDAENRAHGLLDELYEALYHFGQRPSRVRAWLFDLTHQEALDGVAGQVLTGLGSPGHVRRKNGEIPAGDTLDWLNDQDLRLLVERLPVAQRQVLMLRYMAGLGAADIADIVGFDAGTVVELHARAFASIDDSLAAVTRTPRYSGRHAMQRREQATPVLYQRRRALLV
jgi:RNA polymerase sigma-70 factor (ECF subfamily)